MSPADGESRLKFSLAMYVGVHTTLGVTSLIDMVIQKKAALDGLVNV
jgi:hypothetical protein